MSPITLALVLTIAVCVTLTESKEAKTWIFSVSGNRRPYNYIDTEGKLAGFDLDIVRNVCREAGAECAITVQPFTECVQTMSNRFFPGRGLMSGWFDACLGYTITQERVNALQFSLPYLQTYAKMAVKPGNPKTVSLRTLGNRTVVHLTGAYTNQHCLKRLKIPVKNVTTAPNLPVAKAMVLNGSVDAIFSPRTRIPDLQTLDVTLHCDLGGVGVMVTKDSSLPDWWNPAFRELVQNGQYKKMCDTWSKRSKIRIKCFDPSQISIGITSYASYVCLTFALFTRWALVR